jgi:hypothetical protein
MYKRTMVISADEKKVLLARLEKARESKAAKAAATKAAKKETLADVKSSSANAERCERSVAEPEPPAPAPAPVVAPPPVPEPAPIVPPPPSEPIDIPIVPDLVAASKKKPAKKNKKIESSDEDSDDEPVLPPKMKGGTKQAYMKIKIYKEPKNAAAFQSLIEAVQDEQQEEPEVATPPPSSSIGRSCRFANANTNNNSMKKGAGVVSAQELMRRAAMEFFS